MEYASNATLLAESKEDLEKLNMKVKKESEKSGLMFYNKKIKIMLTSILLNELTADSEEVVNSFLVLFLEF